MAEPTFTTLTAPDVKRDGHGRVWVGGVLVVGRGDWWSLNIERRVVAVRERTPDDWWRRAANIIEADTPWNTGGPLGEGVDFLCDDYDSLLPADVRQAIQHDAYEAAREAILDGARDHVRKLGSAIAALGHLGSRSMVRADG